MRRAALVLGLALLAPAPTQAAEPAAAAPVSSSAICELHLWGGGYPSRVVKSNAFVKIIPDPVESDLGNPLSNASLYSTVNRMAKLPEPALLKLFPDGAAVSIVRHAEVLDFDKIKLKAQKTRLSASATPCYADLVMTNIYGIFPNPDFNGMLIDAIEGGNRLVIDFWMQGWSGAAAKPQLFRKKNDAPLLSFRAPRPDFAVSMEAASAELIADFAAAYRAKMMPGAHPDKTAAATRKTD